MNGTVLNRILRGQKEKLECHVLVIYVGGTIGMMKNAEGVYAPSSGTMVAKMRSDPKLHDHSYMTKRNEIETAHPYPTLVLPEVHRMRRIVYSVYEYDPLIDSCNVTSSHWDKIATDIYKNYEFYDGFVVLHGTDTLSYTASALSFMLENLGKSVVITGSQIPIYETRTDGSDNFIGSLIIAGNFTIPEVTVFFHNKLMRGNRTIKFSSNTLDAFTSPNAAELVTLGTEIIANYALMNYDEIFCYVNMDKFTIQTRLNENVGLLRIFPNISLHLVKSFLHSEMDGIVLETYGSGNFISNRKDLIVEIKNAVKRGVIVVNCTQCYTGKVHSNYATGQILSSVGVLCGYDMTSEAALTKLSYVLTKNEWSLEKKKEMFCTVLRGEMSTERIKTDKDNINLMDVLGSSLGLSSKREVMELSNTIFPALVTNAVVKEDISQLDTLKSCGANLNAPNYDHRTALHVACCEGSITMINYLLHNGCLLHVKDRNGRTPLAEAVLHDHHEVIKFLRKCGAHFVGCLKYIGEELCSAAAQGLVERLESYYLAGIDLNSPDRSGRTAFHMAVITNNIKVVEYLLSREVAPKVQDRFGQTALENAESLRNTDILKLLSP
ncbi:L-asparaginase isoform X2 [Planococcus citri]|uniref:L-asparaginase isoform X2 n=1 Tax=Planococcus citri TaxID=170843 RepID=UPI0031F8743A